MTLALYLSIVKASFKYLIKGKTLPTWDYKLQVMVDVSRDLGRATEFPYTEDDLDDINFEYVAQCFDSWQMEESKIPPELGIVQEHILYMGKDISLPSFSELTQQLEGLGVLASPLVDLFKQDLQPGNNRTMEYDVVCPQSLDHNGADNKELLTLCQPLFADEKVLVEIHGGSFNSGSNRAYRLAVGHVANMARTRCLVPNYRLAPRNPFPAQLQDIFMFYQYVLQQGFKPQNVILCGDSAGGLLCLQFLHLLNHLGYDRVGGLILVCPVTNMQPQGASIVDNLSIDYVSMPPLESHPTAPTRLAYKPGHPYNEQYKKELDDPMLCPLNIPKLDYLPPTLVQCGGAEMLVDDIRQFYKKINDESQQKVVYEEYPYMVHGFHRSFHRDESKQALKAIGDFCIEL